MADNANSSSNGLYFIVGGLVVIVGLGAFAFHGGYFAGHGSTTTTEQTTTAPAPNGATTTTTTTEKSRP